MSTNSTELRSTTSPQWLDCVINNFDEFLPDHAAAEKKASGMAITLISHYPDREKLVLAMTDLAVEELSHYREVVRLLYQRGLQLKPDTKDAYVGEMRKHTRQGPENFFLDRLVTAGIIEARGAERFGLIAKGLPDGALKKFYQSITRSEQRHENLFFELAELYFPHDTVHARADELLNIEAEIVSRLPIRAALH
ncbi:MAG: tRNA-(ms[2]io[6]A)-hydroxylase [Pseudomonadales bacterium]